MTGSPAPAPTAARGGNTLDVGADFAHDRATGDEVWSAARHTLLPRLAIGAASGLVATGAMTVAMLGMQQLLPKREQYPLPPRRIVARISCWLGIRRDLDKTSLDALTAVAHFGYGTSMGALYGPIGLALPIPGVISGVAWGLVVWAASYLGLLPALNILSSALHHPPKRDALMIAAHIVWGASLGFVAPRVVAAAGKGQRE